MLLSHNLVCKGTVCVGTVDISKYIYMDYFLLLNSLETHNPMNSFDHISRSVDK